MWTSKKRTMWRRSIYPNWNTKYWKQKHIRHQHQKTNVTTERLNKCKVNKQNFDRKDDSITIIQKKKTGKSEGRNISTKRQVPSEGHNGKIWQKLRLNHDRLTAWLPYFRSVYVLMKSTVYYSIPLQSVEIQGAGRTMAHTVTRTSEIKSAS